MTRRRRPASSSPRRDAMSASSVMEAAPVDTSELELPDDWLLLSDPDLSEVESELVQAALGEPNLSAGTMVQHFEKNFAQWLGRKHAVAVASGTLGTWLVLRALGIAEGDEVIASPYGWHQVAHAVNLTGARVTFADINYWTGCLDPVRAAAQITPATKAILVGNVNGHPAAWAEFRRLADDHGIALIEDSTEAIASRYRGRMVGSFGDLAVFDFSQPAALCCGEGGMVVTDDVQIARALRNYRSHKLADRGSLVISAYAPYQACMSDVSAALGLAQLTRIADILERRKYIESVYFEHIKSFE